MDYKGRIKKVGISVKFLAKYVDVHPVLMSYYINGTRPIPEKREAKMKELLAKYEAVI